MIAFLVAMLLSIAPMEVESGYISAYDRIPTLATIKYRINQGSIPRDLSAYDGMVAVVDCHRIGQEALLVTESATFHVLAFDCAGRTDGGYEWMIDNNVIVEVGWRLRQSHPEIVHKKGRLIWKAAPS
jgi:hypothetical protein